jgi:hypothetical protein
VFTVSWREHRKNLLEYRMAAMPAMNMAEMKTVIKGINKGAGMYEGQGDLGSGGMWQVTVTARQNGQTIATRGTGPISAVRGNTQTGRCRYECMHKKKTELTVEMTA